MNTNRFNQILIVDSIPQGEINTARRIYDDVDTYAKAFKPSPEILFERVESGQEFINLLRRLTSQTSPTSDIPLLHIECHGSEFGFSFADDSFLEWSELKTPLIDLNVATGLNLLVTVAACIGVALAQVVTVGERAPFYGLIGPTRIMLPDELERAYRAFFTKMLETKSSTAALEAMDQASGAHDYARSTAEGLLDLIWKGYLKNYCSQPALHRRATDLQTRMTIQGKNVPPIEVIQQLVLHAGYSRRRQFHETFFMFDLYPENRDRFSFQEV